MSRHNRPMRRYRPSEHTCIKCRGPIVEVEEGWQHVREYRGAFHAAVPA